MWKIITILLQIALAIVTGERHNLGTGEPIFNGKHPAPGTKPLPDTVTSPKPDAANAGSDTGRA